MVLICFDEIVVLCVLVGDLFCVVMIVIVGCVMCFVGMWMICSMFGCLLVLVLMVMI